MPRNIFRFLSTGDARPIERASDGGITMHHTPFFDRITHVLASTFFGPQRVGTS